MPQCSDDEGLGPIGWLIVIALTGGAIWSFPQLGVYYSTMSGKGDLAKAESTRRVKVLEAQAKLDASKMEADAEIERAKGVAEANKIIGSSLQNNPRYLQYLYIAGLQEGSDKGNRTIYVPTEGGMPVPTLDVSK
jgi:hypothetical protein